MKCLFLISTIRRDNPILKYIVASGIALSALFVLLEIGVNIFGNIIKIKREAGISLKIQFMNAIKSKQ